MKVINSKQKNNTMHLEIEASLETINESFNKTFKEMAKLAKIPGFRKGKVPRHIFEQHYGKEILVQDSVNEAVNTSYQLAINELKLEVVDYPKKLKNR